MLTALKNRRTYKVIGDISEAQQPETLDQDGIDELLAAAGNAPFHYACDRSHMESFNSPVPWRVYKLDWQACQALKNWRLENGDTTKIPNMLSAAQFLLQVTWLPDPGTISGDVTSKDGEVFKGTLRNMEHIAAASSFIQSLLLAADVAGFKTYWSSGGPLRTPETFDLLGIPKNQLLLGSIFLFPADPSNVEIKAGALAEKRGSIEDWSRWAKIS